MEAGTRLLITGATGFVGSRLIDLLQGGSLAARALVRRAADAERLAGLGVEPVRGDLADPVALATAVRDVDVVLHLAALTKARREAEYREVNACGTRALVDAVLRADPRPRRLVYLSSLAAVGPSQPGHPVDADTPPRPLTAYGRTKLAGERICAEAAEKLEVVVLRAPAVYGPRDRDLFLYFRMAARGLLPVPTGPERPLQLVHVDDLARALAHVAELESAHGVFYPAEPRAYAWTDVALRIGGAVSRRARLVAIPPAVIWAAASAAEAAAAVAGRATIFNRDKVRELLAPAWTCDTSPAERALGFRARVALDDGLAATARWYREQGWL